jgi:hypothetical protein
LNASFFTLSLFSIYLFTYKLYIKAEMTTTTTTTKSPHEIHIPYLSEDEKIFLNTSATYSQVRRMSTNSVSPTDNRPSMEDNHHHHHHNSRRHQVVSVSSLAFLWKRRGSSTSTLTTSSSTGSIDFSTMQPQQEEDYSQQNQPQSPKARELESLIFTQPQRTVRLSLTPRCAV